MGLIVENIYFYVTSLKEKDNALISPEILLKFNVSEYVDAIPQCEKKDTGELGEDSGIKKAAFLII